MDKQTDVINIEGIDTSLEQLWITIKDASDILNCSERHAWRIIINNGLKSKKMLNQKKKKTYVLRTEIEKYQKDEQERLKFKQSLNRNYDIYLDKKSDNQSAMTEMPMSDKHPAIALISEYRNSFTEIQKKYEKTIQKKTAWKTSALWMIILIVGTCLTAFFYISDMSRTILDKNSVISDKKNTIKILSQTLNVRENALKMTEKDLKIKVQKVLSMKEKIILLKEQLSAIRMERISSDLPKHPKRNQ